MSARAAKRRKLCELGQKRADSKRGRRPALRMTRVPDELRAILEKGDAQKAARAVERIIKDGEQVEESNAGRVVSRRPSGLIVERHELT